MEVLHVAEEETWHEIGPATMILYNEWRGSPFGPQLSRGGCHISLRCGCEIIYTLAPTVLYESPPLFLNTNELSYNYQSSRVVIITEKSKKTFFSTYQGCLGFALRQDDPEYPTGVPRQAGNH
jgi:hypothetical protein